MVKLIRMTTENKNANFDNSISSDLVLEPYSQIALQNLALEFDPDPITVDNSNNQIDFNIVADRPYTSTLDNKTYQHSELDSLLQDIEVKMNAALPIRNSRLVLESCGCTTRFLTRLVLQFCPVFHKQVLCRQSSRPIL